MKNMKKFIALFLSLTMLSTSVAFASESAKGHFSAFDNAPSEVAPQGELDAVSGEFIPLAIAIGIAGYGIYKTLDKMQKARIKKLQDTMTMLDGKAVPIPVKKK